MIVRILQTLGDKNKSHTFAAESFNESTQKWIMQRDCVYHFKNAKVKIKDKLVYLVGYTIDSDDELTQLQEAHFIGEQIDWNDDTKIYPYLEWVSFLEAYS
jgi:hypothetical protein